MHGPRSKVHLHEVAPSLNPGWRGAILGLSEWCLPVYCCVLLLGWLCHTAPVYWPFPHRDVRLLEVRRSSGARGFGELVTPTGAALVRLLSEGAPPVTFRCEAGTVRGQSHLLIARMLVSSSGRSSAARATSNISNGWPLTCTNVRGARCQRVRLLRVRRLTSSRPRSDEEGPDGIRSKCHPARPPRAARRDFSRPRRVVSTDHVELARLARVNAPSRVSSRFA